MNTYLYLSLMPEALLVSMLPPDQFGKYLTIGADRRSRGQALFFAVDPNFESDYFDFSQIEKRCVLHPDGTPRRSSYIAVYRALEHVPLSALRSLFLVTRNGVCLELKQSEFKEADAAGDRLHLYQEFCPVTPRVASCLNPADFCNFVTRPHQPISFPRLVFAELFIGGLAADPERSAAEDIPYSNIGHLRDCLTILRNRPDKMTKIVDREMQRDLLFPMISNGVFVGDQKEFYAYPMPSEDELRSQHDQWWHSATATPGY